MIFEVKLPFPITIKFKSMLQAGVATKDMDPRWMSSISWYFLCIFGLQSVFNFLLGSENGRFTFPTDTLLSSLTESQLRTRWLPKCKWEPSSNRISLDLELTRTSNSRLKRKTWPSLSIIPSWTAWSKDSWRVSSYRMIDAMYMVFVVSFRRVVSPLFRALIRAIPPKANTKSFLCHCSQNPVRRRHLDVLFS
jgi:Integral membrane protein EMC3/TMCO1-like